MQRLFDLARQETAPEAPPEFAEGVLRDVRREPGPRASASFPMFEQLNFLFPRLALAAAVVIVLCAIGNFLLPGADDEMVSADPTMSLEDL